MSVKDLIKENNQKRELLTDENEKYYSDMMIYIRLQLMTSEQKTEEILLELLDHVLDGQRDGKTAKEVFGDNPQAYADEIIEQIPNEDKRSLASFIIGVVVDLIGWIFVAQGLIGLIISQFTEVDNTVYLLNAVIVNVVLGAIIIGGVLYIFKLLKNSLFKDKAQEKKMMIKAGLYGAISFMLLILIRRFVPKVGPSFQFPATMSLIIGGVILLIVFVVKRLKK